MGVDGFTARVEELIGSTEGLRFLADEMVAELTRGDDQRGPRGRGGRRPKRTRRTRTWPYDSGLSRRSFSYRLNGRTIEIRNRQPYAAYVEEGRPSRLTRGSARRQLEAALPRIIEDVELQLERAGRGG